MELKLRSVLRGVKSKSPEKRYEVLDRLYGYQQMEGIEVQVDVLKDFIKTAAYQFPEPVDVWDNPSYYLINYVCDFHLKEVVDALIKHFDALDLKARERAIVYLLSTEDEAVFLFLEEKILALMSDANFELPVNAISEYPYFNKRIVTGALEYLRTGHFKFPLYELILSFNRSGYGATLEKERVLPILLKDYIAEKEEYLRYDAEYSTKFIYSAWKENYLVIRNRMMLYISLMEFYFSAEVESEILTALEFKDPLLKTEALSVCLAKNLPYKEQAIVACAEHIESAEVLYWTLYRRNIQHLYPSSIDQLTQVATSRMFYAILVQSEGEDGYTAFPENLAIVDKVDMENVHGQQGFYYLFTFENNNITYVGWCGVFSNENSEDQINQINASYTEFVEFDSLTIDEHKQEFLKKVEERDQDYNQTTFYEGAPKIRPFVWFLLAILVTRWIRAFSENGEYLLFIIIFTLIIGAMFVYEMISSKKNKVLITGQALIKRKGSAEQRVALAGITKVRHDKKHILIYKDQNQLTMKIPKRWVNYELFCYYINEQTTYLTERPYIQSP